MALIRFDTENTPSMHHGEPRMRIVRQGTITFNRSAEEMMKLGKTTRLSFYQDDEYPEDWFVVCEPDSSNGFKLRFKPNENNRSLIQSASITRKILDSLDIREKSIAFRIVKADKDIAGNETFLIITANRIEGKKKR